MADHPERGTLELQAQETWRRVLIENALDAVVGIDHLGAVIEWNRQAEVTFGWTKDQALGRDMADLIIPDDLRDGHRRGMQHFLHTGQGSILNRRVEVQAAHRNGSRFPVELTVIPIPVGGTFLFYSFVRDLSDRKTLERDRAALLAREKAMRSEAQYRERQLQLIMDSSPAFISFLDREARYRFVNRTYEKCFGVSVEEIRGKSAREILGEAAWQRAKPWLDRALAGETVRYESTLTDKHGRTLQVEVEFAPYEGSPDEGPGVVVMGHDISERKIEERDQQFLIHLAAQLTTTTRVDALAISATRALAEYLAVERCWFAEVDDDTATAVVHHDFATHLPSLRGTYALESFGVEMVASWRTGNIVALSDVKIDPRTAADADAHLAIGIRAFITAPVIRHGRFIGALNVSTTYPRLWARREQALVRGVADSLWPVIENARLIDALTLERRRLESVLEQLPAGVLVADAGGRLLMRNRRMDEILGDTVPADWPLARALRSGDVIRDEEARLVRPDREDVTVSLNAAPVRDEKGAIVAAVLVAIDITQRKELQTRLQAAVAARDEFLSLASHELRTPVTSMKLQFQSAAKQLAAGNLRALELDRTARRIELANRQLARMTRLIDEMMDVSRIAARRLDLKMEKLDLGALVTDVVTRFEADFHAQGMTLNVDAPPGAFVRGDRFRLEQVFENLMTNALKYGERRPVTIRAGRHDASVRATVEDEGIGLAREDAERIFQRFERATSPNISGLGLGLYICRQIAEAHGGRIWSEHRPEGGARFVFELPAVR